MYKKLLQLHFLRSHVQNVQTWHCMYVEPDWQSGLRSHPTDSKSNRQQLLFYSLDSELLITHSGGQPKVSKVERFGNEYRQLTHPSSPSGRNRHHVAMG
jgi:hypothetical protein